MKNIHVLPTDKPSRIFYIAENFHLEKGQLIEPKSYHNVYITSDEEIKEGDWCIDKHNVVYKQETDKIFTKFTGAKKIILTTDPKLIADGIQGIDDTFLEWFVKNPNCESVDINRDWGYSKIIIPQEEPKQETLEEAAENYVRNEHDATLKLISKYSFKDGAKWQQEQNDTSKVKRVEVIQHSPPYNGRAFTNYNAKDVEIQFQDDGRTLKIFLK